MTIHSQLKLEPCLARLGIMPEDKPSFIKEVYAVDDIDILRKLLIEKERERQSVANDLDVAARLGLVISETNEAIQIKLAHLERENQELQDALVYSHNNQSINDSNLHHQGDLLDDERQQLTDELNQARQELTKFRNEMDVLSGQLNDMAAEMIDSKSRVSLYAKRLAEVEHKLTTTREMNTNLQSLLEKALTSQKQSSSTTSHLVKNIQADLLKVITENDQLRARIAELEHQQQECEERLSTMVAQAQEYASLLEQAQNTIHNLSEPRLDDDDLLENDLYSTSLSSSNWEGTQISGSKETEVTKGAVFSVEFRQEMQKEIERNLSIRNEIRHRIITVDNPNVATEKKKKKTAQEGLKSLLADRDHGLLTASTSSSTANSSSATTNMSKSFKLKDDYGISQQTGNTSSPPPHVAPTMNTLRPANFLTGFSGFGNDNSNNIGLNGIKGNNHFMTRGRFTSSPSSIVHKPRYYDHNNNQPSWTQEQFKSNYSLDKSVQKQRISRPKHYIEKSDRHQTQQRNSRFLSSSPTTSITSSSSYPNATPPTRCTPSPTEKPTIKPDHSESATLTQTTSVTASPEEFVLLLISTYKHSDQFIVLKDSGVTPYLFQPLADSLALCNSDPFSWIQSVLVALGSYFTTHRKTNRELTPKFQRLLVQAICRGLEIYLENTATLQHSGKQQIEEPDLIVDDDDDVTNFTTSNQQQATPIKLSKTSTTTDNNIDFFFDDFNNNNNDDDGDNCSDTDNVKSATNIPPDTSKMTYYSLTKEHQTSIINMIDTIDAISIIYYAIDTFKLIPLLMSGGEYEDKGTTLCRLLLRQGYYNEAISCILKLHQQGNFPIAQFAGYMFNVGQGGLLPVYAKDKPTIQYSLLSYINIQLRYNFAGILGVVNPETLKDVEKDTTILPPLQRMRERRFQKELLTCGLKLVEQLGIPEDKYYFIWLSQQYASLRWVISARSAQQAMENNYTIEASSNYNGLVELVVEGSDALGKLAIKELVDLGDAIGAQYFAIHLQQITFFEFYQSLQPSERMLGVIKGEQISHSLSTYHNKKSRINTNTDLIYTLPNSVECIIVDDEPGVIAMKHDLVNSKVCGLDSEWVPTIAKSGKVQTALIQIATDNNTVYLLDLKTLLKPSNVYLLSLTESILRQVFESKTCLKLAYEFGGDLSLLGSCMPGVKSWHISNFKDMNKIRHFNNNKLGQPITGGLAGVVTHFLGVSMNKKQQLSNWEKRPLTIEQIHYAACDAYCLLEIYQTLTNLGHPFTIDTPVVKTLIPTMNASSSFVKPTLPSCSSSPSSSHPPSDENGRAGNPIHFIT
ncbi:uncharacterized protein BX664DRAFT_280827 [Halteromyces radiatus]|uniref:uncharacterized protein n=1 Tax=Halteromyces radiatus TaxID=101107 RepID=UPI002220723C|nr:uncharacterized protein BX664DRAFT_280827 [Halteromyces radiatus]KAI8089693.1 hypothetical protein BX664DRAFT_280827 [Halteromyces radiatus]